MGTYVRPAFGFAALLACVVLLVDWSFAFLPARAWTWCIVKVLGSEQARDRGFVESPEAWGLNPHAPDVVEQWDYRAMELGFYPYTGPLSLNCWQFQDVRYRFVLLARFPNSGLPGAPQFTFRARRTSWIMGSFSTRWMGAEGRCSPSSWRNLFGFCVNWGTDRMDVRYKYLVVAVPHWFLAAACAGSAWMCVAPVRRRHRRLRRGLCPACAYDLRATPERCPECGRETTPAERERIRKLHGPADGPGAEVAGAPGLGPLATAAGAGGGETDPHPGPLPADRESGRTT
jgi:hypothetical protein